MRYVKTLLRNQSLHLLDNAPGACDDFFCALFRVKQVRNTSWKAIRVSGRKIVEIQLGTVLPQGLERRVELNALLKQIMRGMADKPSQASEVEKCLQCLLGALLRLEAGIVVELSLQIPLCSIQIIRSRVEPARRLVLRPLFHR